MGGWEVDSSPLLDPYLTFFFFKKKKKSPFIPKLLLLASSQEYVFSAVY